MIFKSLMGKKVKEVKLDLLYLGAPTCAIKCPEKLIGSKLFPAECLHMLPVRSRFAPKGSSSVHGYSA